ncbi:MAG: hypothetical protein RMK74_12525 [Myxococcales bacterium]|nr:hypothetical protein [Myxococcales bacterium]
MKRSARAAIVATWTVVLAGCEGPAPPSSSFYDERIGPALSVGCALQTQGCHLADERGTAAGNLDLSSFDALMRRQDVLPAYGPYPVGLLLLKGGEPVEVGIETFDPPDPSRPEERVVRIRTDIRHAAGAGLSMDARTYAEVKAWIERGATRTGIAYDTRRSNEGRCRNGVGHLEGFDPAAAPADMASYEAFRDRVQPVLRARCAGGACHGNPIADLYLACGDDEAELRWNYFVSVQHLTTPVSASELLRRPLAVLRGGTFHEGGDVFASTEDEGYVAIRQWAEELAGRRPELVEPPEASEGLRFFANRVQPVLVRKGCMFLNCHSPAMFHDLRLRGGSQGAFSRVATLRNYEMSRHLLAYDSPDPNDSRLIAKNLYPPTEVPGAEGMAHRGGFLFEDFSRDGRIERATPDDCAGVDADRGDLNEIPAYCVLVRWHQLEREAAIARGEVMAGDGVEGLVYVSRPAGGGGVVDFDTFAGDADLRFASVDVAPDGSVSLGASRSLLGGCGLPAGADVRTPAVSWDGRRVAFAARGGAGEPLRLYEVGIDGSGCRRIPGIAPAEPQRNGILQHDFDPAWAPDGRLVFASTRGHLDASRFSYAGPTRTPARMQPNANLYIAEDGSVRQLTFLLNQEVSPSFMHDGRLVFTTEKREPDFHQLAGRRLNLDGGDYHPLFAQRPSIGFASATEIVVDSALNLLMVAGPLDAADGAGHIVLVNRSIGPDQVDRDPADRFYIRSTRTLTSTGAWRSPVGVPGGRILASCDLDAADVRSGPMRYEICELDPTTGAHRVVGGEPGRSAVELVLARARANYGVFRSRIDEANGHTRVEPGATDAEVLVQDFPMLGTLLFTNTREGRPIDHRMGGFEVHEALPPPPEATTFADVASEVVRDAFGEVFVRRRRLGWVPLEADGSARFRFEGGTPIVLVPTDASGRVLEFLPGAPFTGPMFQREQMQFYPGERANQSIPRRFFNGLCGGCHGSITGRELDVVVQVDALTSASRTLARDAAPVDLR